MGANLWALRERTFCHVGGFWEEDFFSISEVFTNATVDEKLASEAPSACGHAARLKRPSAP